MECRNCRGEIGDLETPHLWKDHVVCERCYGKLAGQVVPVRRIAQQATFIEEYEHAPMQIAEPIDPIQSLSIAHSQRNSQSIPGLESGPAQTYPPAQNQPVFTQVILHHPPRNGRGLLIAGGVIMLISLPLMCVGGIGFLTFIVGLILLIVGACI